MVKWVECEVNMKVNYWDCPYSDYDESYDGDKYYWCKHPNRENAICGLNNKYCEDTDECTLLTVKQTQTKAG